MTDATTSKAHSIKENHTLFQFNFSFDECNVLNG